MFRRLSAGAALISVSSAALSHWVMQFDGECSQTGSNEVTCDGKALSQTISAYIDVNTGVDWSVAEQQTGPIASLYIISHGTETGFDAEGSIKFQSGGPDTTYTTLNFEYNQDDVTRIVHGTHFIEAGFTNITGGTVGYEMAQGFLTLNIHGQVGDSTDWTAVIEAAIGHDEQQQQQQEQQQSNNQQQNGQGQQGSQQQQQKDQNQNQQQSGHDDQQQGNQQQKEQNQQQGGHDDEQKDQKNHDDSSSSHSDGHDSKHDSHHQSSSHDSRQ